MKGLTHFVSGVTVASFIPLVSRMSISSRMDIEGAMSSMILALAGLYGIMPDTMDFKLGQFFAKAEYVLDPHPVNPDPQEMADAFAAAVNQAAETGKEVRIQFYPTQLAANRWRQYCLVFEEHAINVQFNEIITTSQIPMPGTAFEHNRVGRAEFKYRLKPTTNEVDWLNKFIRWLRIKIKGGEKEKIVVKPSTVDILSSTMFGLKMEKDGKIFFNWLPWHRTWSHSYVFGAILTIPVFVLAYFLKLEVWWLYGLVSFIGFATHITEDMTGHIGGSLLWPLMKERTEGLEIVKASNPSTNFSIIYSSFVITLWNLDRFTTQVITGGPEASLASWQYLLFFWIIPMFIYFKIIKMITKNIKHKKEIMKEEEEPDGIGDPVID